MSKEPILLVKNWPKVEALDSKLTTHLEGYKIAIKPLVSQIKNTDERFNKSKSEIWEDIYTALNDMGKLPLDFKKLENGKPNYRFSFEDGVLFAEKRIEKKVFLAEMRKHLDL